MGRTELLTLAEMVPWRRLAAATLSAAVKDWRRISAGEQEFLVPPQGGEDAVRVNRTELVVFFSGGHFVNLCDMCDVEPETFRARLKVTRETPYWKKKRRERKAKRAARVVAS